MLSLLKELYQTSLKKDTTVELALKNENLTRTAAVEQCTGFHLIFYNMLSIISPQRKTKISRLNMCTEILNYITLTLSMFSPTKGMENKQSFPKRSYTFPFLSYKNTGRNIKTKVNKLKLSSNFRRDTSKKH